MHRLGLGKWVLLGCLLNALPAFSANAPPLLRVSIGSQDSAIAFDQKEITVKPNQPIQLSFTNHSEQGSTLSHTWVLLKPGTETGVTSKAIQAGESKGYIPDSPDIIAHTGLTAPGQTSTVRFNAPAQEGDYPFICTYPGHSSSMKGILKVRK